MQRKIEKKSFFFKDNSIWIGWVNSSLLGRKYLSLGVNVLRNSLNILHRTEIDFFQLNYVHIDQ